MNLSIHKDENIKLFYHSRNCMKINYYYQPTQFFKKNCIRIEAMIFNCKFNNVIGSFLLKNICVEKDNAEQLNILYDQETQFLMPKERKITFTTCQDVSIVGATKFYQLNRTFNNQIKFNDQDEENANSFNFYLEKQFVTKTQKERYREF